MLRMSEVNKVDHQSMQHMLTEGCVDWQGFGRQIAQEANELLGGTDAVLIFDESGFAKKGKGVAIFAKDCFGHPSPSNRQKLNATNQCLRRPSRPASLVAYPT